jgi:hypothetical protein
MSPKKYNKPRPKASNVTKISKITTPGHLRVEIVVPSSDLFRAGRPLSYMLESIQLAHEDVFRGARRLNLEAELVDTIGWITFEPDEGKLVPNISAPSARLIYELTPKVET